MRKDASKKLVERPRHNSSWGEESKDTRRVNRNNPRLTEHFDEESGKWEIESNAASRGKMSMGLGSKSFNEYFSPFYRWLKKQVGRPWDNVYSDIRERLDPKSTVQMHVMQHLWDWVERYVKLEDGELVLYTEYSTSGPEKLSEMKGYYNSGEYDLLYIHPVTKLFCKQTIKKREEKTKEICVYEESNQVFLCKLKGIWYRVTWNVTQSLSWCKKRIDNLNEGTYVWTLDDQGMKSKQQLSSKDLKHHKLSNDR